MAEKRIYVVTEAAPYAGQEGKKSLVRANSQAQAIKAIVGNRFAAEAASADDVATMMGNGAKIVDAGAESDPAPQAQ